MKRPRRRRFCIFRLLAGYRGPVPTALTENAGKKTRWHHDSDAADPTILARRTRILEIAPIPCSGRSADRLTLPIITTREPPMHFDAHQPVINDLEARILTIRDSL
jgi:hypothetical protein